MLDRTSIGAVALTAALCLAVGSAQAFDDAKYPDLKGQWIRVSPPGQPAFDPSKPRGRGQQVPFTPEYQAVFEANLADLAAGGEGLAALAADDDGGHLLAQEGLGRDLEMAHEHLDDIGEGDLAPAQRRGLLDQGRAQDRLQRPEQAAVGLLDIGGNGLGAEAHAIAILILEEDGARDERALALHRRQGRRIPSR